MNKPLNVLHLNASSSGGAFVVAQRLSEALNQIQDVHSEHLVFTGKTGNFTQFSEGFFKKKYAFFKHALEKLDFLRYEKDSSVRFAFSHGLTGIDMVNHPMVKAADVVHMHWINKGFVSLNGIDKLLNSGKPVVWTAHDQWPFTGGCYYSGTCFNYQKGCGNCRLLKHPSDSDLSHMVFDKKKRILSDRKNLKVVTPSQWLANKGHEAGTLGNSAIHVIQNGIDTSLFHADFRSAARKKNGLETDVNTILFAAVNIADPRKGFNEFLQFLHALKAQGIENAQVIYIGENKGNIAEAGPYPHRFTGFVSDPAVMADWYRSGTVYVTTSNDDNLPTTIMESLSCGTPVAAFSAGGIPEMIVDGKTGALSGVYDSETLAAKTAALLRQEQISEEKMSGFCREFAVANYSKNLIAEKYLSLYRQF